MAQAVVSSVAYDDRPAGRKGNAARSIEPGRGAKAIRVAGAEANDGGDCAPTLRGDAAHAMIAPVCKVQGIAQGGKGQVLRVAQCCRGAQGGIR